MGEGRTGKEEDKRRAEKQLGSLREAPPRYQEHMGQKRFESRKKGPL